MSLSLVEAQRRHYLQALGLPQLVARQPLVASAPSRYVYSPDAEPVASPVAAPVKPVLRPKPEPMPAPRSAPKLMPAPSVPVVAPVGVAPIAAATPALTFSCHLYLLGADRLALITTSTTRELSAAELKLWQSLCAAMQWQAQADNARFDWPFSYARHLANDATAAKDALTAWWQARCELPAQILVVGDAPADLLPPACLVLPSLADMLQTPSLKKQCWLRLQV